MFEVIDATHRRTLKNVLTLDITFEPIPNNKGNMVENTPKKLQATAACVLTLARAHLKNDDRGHRSSQESHY